MSRNTWCRLAVVAALAAAVPRTAAAQHCISFTEGSPCRLLVVGPWANVDFGAPKLVPEPRVAFATRSRGAHAEIPGAFHASGSTRWRRAPAEPPVLLHRAHTGTVRAAAVRDEAAQNAQTADEIVEKHLAALGGREALGRLTSRRSTGTITLSTPNGTLSGPCEVLAKAPNKTRAHMQLDLSPLGVPEKMVVEQKFDGAAGWSLNSMQGDAEITGNQLQNMRNNTFPSSLLTYKAAGTKIEVLPAEQIDGRKLLVLLATPKEGSAIRMFFDAETYMLVRTVLRVNSPLLGGEVEQTAQLSDYRVVDGVKVPFHIVNGNAMQTGTITLTRVEHNVPLDDALFSVKRPAPRPASRSRDLHARSPVDTVPSPIRFTAAGGFMR